MKISCTQENLNKGLNTVSHIANKNISLPILNSVLIKAENKSLKVSSTNLEIGITSTIRGKIDKEGEFATEAKILTNYIGLLPKNGNVLLEKHGSSLNIKCDNYHTQIRGNNTNDFPLIPTSNKDKGFIFNSQDIKEALQQVIFSASVSELRPEISGVFFSFNDNELTLAATDSYRLAEKKINFTMKNNNNNDNESSIEIILPLRTVQEILRILNLNSDDVLKNNEHSKKVEFYIEDNQISLVCNNTELVSKTIEGQYPDYRQIIPQDFKTSIVINNSELQKAIKVTSLFSKLNIYDVLLNIKSNGEVEIMAENTQLGKNSTKIKAEVNGENNDIVLNYKYLLDGLQNINSDIVIIDIVDNSVPCLIRPHNKKEQDGYIYLIMPIKQ